ncbi:MAG: sigma-70 family RNA polymerase sigma factor [Actinomycetota bacterium]|nr:sigma-70 family RNA polymerase sigma factor [Actinomycetota bacterium]MDP9484560.1 sigma-70 family RNA polymerase sigma factor [Actinomycetota bacterium]
MMGDEHLIEAVATGDDAALRELFARHAPWIASRLRRAMPAHAVEDALQETFVAVWQGAKGYRRRAGVDAGAWIWIIARRQAALWARKNGRPEGFLEPAPDEDPASASASRVDLDRALNDLGPQGQEQRELAWLVFFEDRSVADVASTLGIPEGTVKSRVYKLRKLLRASLTKGDYR